MGATKARLCLNKATIGRTDRREVGPAMTLLAAEDDGSLIPDGLETENKGARHNKGNSNRGKGTSLDHHIMRVKVE